jgi:hypothetical protein
VVRNRCARPRWRPPQTGDIAKPPDGEPPVTATSRSPLPFAPGSVATVLILRRNTPSDAVAREPLWWQVSWLAAFCLRPPLRAVESAAHSCGGSRGFVHHFPCMQVAVHTSAPTAFPVESLTGTTSNTLASAWSDGQEKFNTRYLGVLWIKIPGGGMCPSRLKVRSGSLTDTSNGQRECRSPSECTAPFQCEACALELHHDHGHRCVAFRLPCLAHRSDQAGARDQRRSSVLQVWQPTR